MTDRNAQFSMKTWNAARSKWITVELVHHSEKAQSERGSTAQYLDAMRWQCARSSSRIIPAQNADRDLKPASRCLDRMFRLGVALLTLVIGVTKLVLNIVAADSNTLTEPESDQNSLEFGVLNYRTGKFDNGLDPLGWYDLD